MTMPIPRILQDGNLKWNAEAQQIIPETIHVTEDGSLGAVAIGFDNDRNSGLYRTSAGELAVAVNGAQQLVYDESLGHWVARSSIDARAGLISPSTVGTSPPTLTENGEIVAYRETPPVIDDFERGNLDPYFGDVADFEVSTEQAFDGVYSLKATNTNANQTIYSTTGLDNYFNYGSTAVVRLYRTGANINAYLAFGYADADNRTFAGVNGNNGNIEVFEVSGGAFNSLGTASVSNTAALDEWARLEVGWGETADTITLEYRDNDGTLLQDLSVTTPNNQGNTGIGLSVDTRFDAGTAYLDGFRRAQTDIVPSASLRFQADNKAYEVYTSDTERYTYGPGRITAAANTTEEVNRFQLDNDRVMKLRHVELQQIGGGTSTDLALVVNSDGVEIARVTLGDVEHTPGVESDPGALVTFALENTTATAQDIAPRVVADLIGDETAFQ